MAGDDGYRLYLDGKRVIDHWVNTDRLHAEGIELELQAGRYALTLEYYDDERDAGVRLLAHASRAPFDEALDAAREADVVVFVGGLTGDVEGEEMTVNYPGFAGGDRTDCGCPRRSAPCWRPCTLPASRW